MQEENVKIERALISCSDKNHLIPLAQALHQMGVELISTGGTKEILSKENLPVTPIERITGNPESFGGRMKTISFQVESALLWRRNNSHDIHDAQKLAVPKIDLVVCNLYPFEQAVKRGASEEELIENIDIGGPTMIRAGAKNYESVCVLTNPKQYANFIDEFLSLSGFVSFSTRRNLATQAFIHSAQYEAMIATELTKRFLGEEILAEICFPGKKLRYGENPHQKGVYFSKNNSDEIGVGEFASKQGKEISYNNLLDADAAWKCARDLKECLEKYSINKNVAVVVKHLNPCGVATGKTAANALAKAWSCDPVSSFGSIICFSHEVDLEVANWLGDKFVELILAPQFSPEALDKFSKKKNLRVIEIPLKKNLKPEIIYKSISGGILKQEEDENLDSELRSVTENIFPEEKLPLAHYGIMINKHLKSNGVALVGSDLEGDFILAGAGMGQPNRIESLKLLAKVRAEQRKLVPLNECILISDAFFPFADSIEACYEVGVKFIVQPGGSIRDDEVIRACNENNISMIFTGRRHFRH